MQWNNEQEQCRKQYLYTNLINTLRKRYDEYIYSLKVQKFIKNSQDTMITVAIDFVVWEEHAQWKSWRGSSIEGRGKITRYNTIATKGRSERTKGGRGEQARCIKSQAGCTRYNDLDSYRCSISDIHLSYICFHVAQMYTLGSPDQYISYISVY